MAKQKIYTVTMTLPDGSRRYYRAATREEAEAKREKDQALLGLGINISDNSTFKELAEYWFKLVKEEQLHKKSQEIIRSTLNTHVYPRLGHRLVKEVKPADIMALMKSVSRCSSSLQKKVLQYTKAIFGFAVDNDLIVKNPVISSIKAGGATPDEVTALTDAQCTALLKAVQDTRAYLFVELLLYTGLRRGEALGLMWQDIDFDKSVLSVCRSIVYPDDNPAGEINSELKTSNARRVVPIVPWLLEDLQAAKKKSSSLYVFSMQNGSFLSKSALRRMWDIVSNANLGFSVHPHQLRHTCITRWIESGLGMSEAQYLAGHATADITMNIYTHYRKEQLLTETAKKMGQIKVANP